MDIIVKITFLVNLGLIQSLRVHVELYVNF